MSHISGSESPKVQPLHPLHPVRVPGVQYGKDETNYHLGRRIAHLRYDQIIDLLWGILDEIWEQFKCDEERDRISLAKAATHVIVYLRLTIVYFVKMHLFSKPHMEHEFDAHPESDAVDRNGDE